MALYEHVEAYLKSNREAAVVSYEDIGTCKIKSAIEIIQLHNEIAFTLSNNGCVNEVVALLLPTCVELPSILLGILKSSNSFLTLGNAPLSRVHYLIRKFCIRYFLGMKDSVQSVFESFSYDTLHSVGDIVVVRLTNLSTRQWPACLTYVITTSGTTSDPKVVFVGDNCILSNIVHLRQIYRITEKSVCLLVSPLSFDPSIVEMFTALTSQANLVLLSETAKLSPSHVLSVIKKYAVTHLQCTPSFARMLGTSRMRTLLGENSCVEVLAFGGEEFPLMEIRKWKHTRNKTRLLNLYGITEVSCWATCHELTACDLSDQESYEACLGEPLGDTELQLSSLVNNDCFQGPGVGRLYISSLTRRACINDESIDMLLKKDAICRDTGDICKRSENGQLFYIGRVEGDTQVKRHGKRMNLRAVEQVSMLHPDVDSAICHYEFKACALKLAIIPRQTRRSVQSEEDFKDIVSEHLAERLESHYIPDVIQIFNTIPLTIHGKVDKTKLFTDWKAKVFSSEEEVTLWFATQGFGHNDLLLVEQGADSLRTVHLTNELREYGVDSDSTLDILLHQPLGHAIRQIWMAINDSKPAYPLPNTAIVPRETLEFGRCIDCTAPATDRVTAISRCSNISVNFQRQRSTMGDIELVWTYDTGKCIDASPLLVEDSHGSAVAYVGSHSRQFAAVRLETGTLVWKVELPDRIESSACVTTDGRFVLVGCYDGCVYCLHRDTGTEHCHWQTGDLVKSSPAVDPLTGLIACGSHDQRVYIFNPASNNLTAYDIGRGGIYASVTFSQTEYADNCVYGATLKGRIFKLKLDGGVMFYDCGHAVFSSPAVHESTLCVGDVSGRLLCLATKDMSLLWQLKTDGAIFSSPSILACKMNGDNVYSEVDTRIVFGSNDKHIYCVDRRGHELWKHAMTAPVFSSVYVFRHDKECYVCAACNTGSVVLLNLADGSQTLQYDLPGEVFSSPLVSDDKIVIGCRNDLLYCMRIM